MGTVGRVAWLCEPTKAARVFKAEGRYTDVPQDHGIRDRLNSPGVARFSSLENLLRQVDFMFHRCDSRSDHKRAIVIVRHFFVSNVRMEVAKR